MSEEWGYSILKEKLLENKELYGDKDFPPSLISITFDGKITEDFPVSEITWKRPKELTDDPKFIKTDARRSDLDQGILGDCWFVAAAALLANGSTELFEKCVLPDQGFDSQNYAGIFHFKFWDYGIWKEVVIDDLLPTDGKKLLFCQNREDVDEFWGALLEKAYAKHKGGCYEALNGGKLGTALVDFTGGLSEMIYLSKPKVELPSDLYALLRKNSTMDSFMGAAIYRHSVVFGRETRLPNGLFQGHAYSITGLSEVVVNSSVVQLLRLRNPHGENEWTGPWSDNSVQMKSLPSDVKDKLEAISKDDGEFWMSFEDFKKNFDELCLCHLLPESFDNLPTNSAKRTWRVIEYHDAWIKGITAGGCGNPPLENLFWKNPQFQVQLIDPDTDDNNNLCTIIVSLMEKERLVDMNDVTIGFDIYEIRSPQTQPINGEMLPKPALRYVARSGPHQGYREAVRRFELKPGYYVIIPSTFYPYKEASFLIRIYTEKPASTVVLDDNNQPVQLSSLEQDPIFDIFKKHSGDDNKMDYKELKSFIEEATSKDFDKPLSFQEETCRSLLILMDKDRSGFLNMVEAQHAYKEIKAYVAVFKQFDKDKSNAIDSIELGTMFRQLGFPVSRNVLLSIVRRYGGRDMQISLEDFIVSICKLTTMYNVFAERQRNVAGPEDVAVFTRNEFLEHTMFC